MLVGWHAWKVHGSSMPLPPYPVLHICWNKLLGPLLPVVPHQQTEVSNQTFIFLQMLHLTRNTVCPVSQFPNTKWTLGSRLIYCCLFFLKKVRYATPANHSVSTLLLLTTYKTSSCPQSLRKSVPLLVRHCASLSMGYFLLNKGC